MQGLLQQLVNGSPFGIVVVDAKRQLQILNPVARRLVTSIGNPLFEAFEVAIPVPQLHALVPSIEEEEGQALSSEFDYGNSVLKAHSTPLSSMDSNETFQGRLLILEDVTQAKRLERTQREFVANVSHELRTPTTSIAGFAQMLLDDKESLSADHQMMVAAIHRNALRLHNLFEDLLTLSKIEANDGPLPLDELYLLGIVQECVDRQSVRADDKGITLYIFISESLKILGNRDALQHIIGNFVENAIKYSFEHQVVTIRAALRSGFVQLEVIDLGEGISPNDQKRIFERFYRVDKSRSRAVGGTGLGLAIVKTLLDRTGIRLEVRSQVGKGSIFRIYLPPGPSMLGENP